jgi:hypothetical protein
MRTPSRLRSLENHMFNGTGLVMLFLGSLSTVFRDDIEAKVVSVVCSTTLFLMAVLSYVRRQRQVP